MKPMGRKAIRFPSKTDGHFKKDGLINWWEAVIDPCKRRERQRVRRELKEVCIESIQT